MCARVGAWVSLQRSICLHVFAEMFAAILSAGDDKGAGLGIFWTLQGTMHKETTKRSLGLVGKYMDLSIKRRDLGYTIHISS